MNSHFEQEHIKAIDNCIKKCEACIDECQNIVEKCSMRTPIECGVEIGEAVIACTACIEAAVILQNYCSEHIEKCQEAECIRLNHECIEKIEICVKSCEGVIEFCKERERICIDSTLKCIQACTDLSKTCQQLKNL